MTEKEAQEVLDELNTVRPEKLNENAKRLFEAIMKIADERDLYKNIIKEVREKVEELAELYDDNYTISDKAKDILELIKENKQ